MRSSRASMARKTDAFGACLSGRIQVFMIACDVVCSPWTGVATVCRALKYRNDSTDAPAFRGVYCNLRVFKEVTLTKIAPSAERLKVLYTRSTSLSPGNNVVYMQLNVGILGWRCATVTACEAITSHYKETSAE